MDIKEQIESIVEKLQKDKALQAQFKKTLSRPWKSCWA